MNATLQSWARALGGEVRAEQVLCPGPGHSAQDRSLSVTIGKDGEPVVYSHAGDDWKLCRDHVRERLGLAPFKLNVGRKTVATYDFRDPTTGEVRYRKERVECADGKKSFFFKPKGRNGSEPLLYGGERLADVQSEQPVFVVEGEKKVDRLRELGAAAVSGDTGYESKWLPSHADLLRGLDVVLWPDSDAPGEEYAANAAKCLKDFAASLRVVRPFGQPNGAKGRDVCDWHGNADDLAALAAGAEIYEAREAAPALTPVVARPFVWRDPKTIPPRQWLYGRHYIRKFVSATVAAPGIGKSSLDLVELIVMAFGRPLLGVPVPKQLRVWYWNLEDPYDEIERRIAAALLHFNIDPAEIEGRLFVNSGRDDPLVIAEKHRDSTVIHAPIADALAAEIIARGVDVLSIDPFVSCHRVPENDNGAIDAVTKAFGKIADAANCSIDLVHHVRKPANGQAEFDVNDARGASALIGTVRAARVLNSMTKDDAEAAGVHIKHKGYYFSVTNGKANMSPPAEKADWFKFVSAPLGNDTAETKGDDVGVVTKWKFPGLFDEMAASDLFTIQKAIAAAQWRADARSPDWVGNAVAKVLELDTSTSADKKRIKAMLKIWIETGALKEVERKTEQRKPSFFVEVGNWANT